MGRLGTSRPHSPLSSAAANSAGAAMPQPAGCTPPSNGPCATQQQQQQQQQQKQKQKQQPEELTAPRLGLDLRIHPPALHQAYWRDRARRHISADSQVAWLLLAVLAALTPKHLAAVGALRTAVVCGPPWLLVLGWLTALRSPGRYIPCRHAIVVAARLAMCFSVSVWAAGGGAGAARLYRPMQYSSPAFAVLAKVLLSSHCCQMALEAAWLQLPVLLQAGTTALQAAALLAGGVAAELVAFCHAAPERLAALEGAAAAWGRLVQSGAAAPPLALPRSGRLAGRSCSALAALAALHATAVGLVAYAAYMLLWADVRAWARRRAEAQAAAGPCRGDAAAARLRGLAASPAGALLLDGRGPLGRASMACLHAAAANVVCLACLLASRLLVQLVLPEVLPPRWLDALYPPLLPLGLSPPAGGQHHHGEACGAQARVCAVAQQWG